MKQVIWIADDDDNVRYVLAAALRDEGYEVREFADAAAVLAIWNHVRPALLMTDVRMPGDDGLVLLRRVREISPTVPVMVMSAYADVTTTAAAYRTGAADYLAKPFDLDQVLAAVRRVLADAGSHVDITVDKPLAAKPGLIGQSAAMHEVFRLIGRVAASHLNVLVTGETGTGKELVARALHEESLRQQGPFIALNTAAIPAELLESELFGHEAGAFTGARERRIGRFEQAEGGTLFLDEIGDMPLSLQTRLLRVLAGGEFYRVGGRALIKSHVRIIAATHQDLDALVADGRFRADLKHRLDVVRIALPPLRERRGDITRLARHFLAMAAQELGLPAKRFSAGAIASLERRTFPGNVRELENLCRRAAVMAPGKEVQLTDLPDIAESESGEIEGDWTAALHRWTEGELAEGRQNLYPRARDAMEQVLFETTLHHVHGHRQRAAKLLGLGRNTLTRKLTGQQPGD
ncbi:MAG TPA: nitrogen regulation protein NR(I) [Rhodanobacteraceae bacterium]